MEETLTLTLQINPINELATTCTQCNEPYLNLRGQREQFEINWSFNYENLYR